MVRIRLRKTGARNQPSFRIVVADKRSPRDGRFIEAIGHYNPRTEPATVSVDEARLYHWLSEGADPSQAVVQVLRSYGAWDRWERLKAGEDQETLLQEAAAQAEATEIDPRTKREDFSRSRPSRKAQAKASAGEEPGADADEAEATAADDSAEADEEAGTEAAEETPEADDAEQAEAQAEPEAADEEDSAAEEAPDPDGQSDAEAEAESEADPEAEVDEADEPEAEEADDSDGDEQAEADEADADESDESEDSDEAEEDD